MASFDEFKTFIKDKPYLKEKVKNKKTTWQELYEHYDLYGEKDEIFSEENLNDTVEQEQTNNEKKDDTFSSFFNMLSGIDVDKISEGLNGMKKILNILSEVTVGDDVSVNSRRGSKPYKRDDD